VLEVFLDGLSTRLRAGQGLPSSVPDDILEPASLEMRRRLTLFTDNARRLPSSVHQRLATALNRDQIPSKLWLIDCLSDVMPLQESHIMVVGGWYGILPLLFRCLHPSWRVRTDLIDVDPAACEVAATLLDSVVENVTIACKNALAFDYREIRQEPRSVVVNTVCEHMSDFVDWFSLLQPGQQIALQSNDHIGCSEHTNCAASLQVFEKQAPLAETHFRGTLPLANFRRFMLIGRR
jgi:hypothetical protein